MKTLLLELELFFGERSAWLLLTAFVAALAYGAYNADAVGEAARADAKSLLNATAEREAELRTLLERSPIEARQVARQPSVAQLPPAPFAALAVGQSDLLPAHERLSVFRAEQPSAARTELENPSRLSAGRFDLAFVLIWLLPLFLLAAAYDLCAGDREAGTLRMVLAQGTSPRTWIARRALARGAPFLCCASAAVAWASSSSQADDIAARLGLAVLLIVAYGLFWLAVAALVNTFARSAAAAATAAGAAWVLLVLVLPTLLNVVVESLHPSPSRAELVAEAREAAADAERRGNELVSSFYRDHPELAPPGLQADMLSRMMAVQDEVGRAMEPVKARFAQASLEQQREVERWRFASPAIAANEALTDLAGTGYWRHRAFQEQVDAFKEQLLAFYEPKFHKRQPIVAADLVDLPRFEFEEEPRAEWSRRTGSSAGGILGLAAAVTLGAAARLSPRRLAA